MLDLSREIVVGGNYQSIIRKLDYHLKLPDLTVILNQEALNKRIRVAPRLIRPLNGVFLFIRR